MNTYQLVKTVPATESDPETKVYICFTELGAALTLARKHRATTFNGIGAAAFVLSALQSKDPVRYKGFDIEIVD